MLDEYLKQPGEFKGDEFRRHRLRTHRNVIHYGDKRWIELLSHRAKVQACNMLYISMMSHKDTSLFLNDAFCELIPKNGWSLPEEILMAIHDDNLRVFLLLEDFNKLIFQIMTKEKLFPAIGIEDDDFGVNLEDSRKIKDLMRYIFPWQNPQKLKLLMPTHYICKQPIIIRRVRRKK
ncbi:hypothetical protein ACTOI6_18960 (plasmid) [Komagataeibacter intermedius]|uniref:hypothetical protein n=1 Tax=Komagataeibacter intermedius TaxID=66229 RepID=UPI00403571D9